VLARASIIRSRRPAAAQLVPHRRPKCRDSCIPIAVERAKPASAIHNAARRRQSLEPSRLLSKCVRWAFASQGVNDFVHALLSP